MSRFLGWLWGQAAQGCILWFPLRFLPNASAEMSDTGVSEPVARAQTLLMEGNCIGVKV